MDDRLGLDSISFETFAWPAGPGDLGSRLWLGEGVWLFEQFFPSPPDLPGLDLEELRLSYEAQGVRSDRAQTPRRTRWLRSARMPSDARTTKLIDLTVARDTPVPIVCVIMRVPLPDRHLFAASLTLPLAECSWVVSVQAAEPDMTGIREAIALDSFLRGQGPAGEQHDKPSADESLQETMAGFEPYQSRWDGLVRRPTNHSPKAHHARGAKPRTPTRSPRPGALPGLACGEASRKTRDRARVRGQSRLRQLSSRWRLDASTNPRTAPCVTPHESDTGILAVWHNILSACHGRRCCAR